MSSPPAFVVLAHSDPPKVRRLLGALDGADVFLHCDVRAARETLAAMIPPGQDRIVVVDRVAPQLGSWSLVEAELCGVRAALQRSDAEHIVVMSGACYPLRSLAALAAELERSAGQSRFELHPIPYERWSTRIHNDGGRWRFTRWFPTVNDQVLKVGRLPISIGRHTIPSGVELYASSHWKIYARAHAEALLRVLSDCPEQRAYWRHTYVPEETCAASILRSPALVGDLSESVINDPAWYIRWPTVGSPEHPLPLRLADFDDLSASGRLFARKIGGGSADLLDRIDAELRGDGDESAD